MNEKLGDKMLTINRIEKVESEIRQMKQPYLSINIRTNIMTKKVL